MPTSIEDLIILLDAQVMDSPYEVRDAWRIVRGHLRQRRRPSSTTLPTVDTPEEPITERHHFRAATDILRDVNTNDKKGV